MNLLKPKFWEKNNLIVLLLLPLTLITRLIIFIKNKKKKYKSEIKLICVGNIYLGGTGKTQLVMKINEILKKKSKTFVIKKYYKNQIDEQKLLSKSAKLLMSEKRLLALKKIKKTKNTVAIFDDGLQDKSIEYSISIVCFNSLTGVGNEKLLPAGPLREDLSELKNYNAVFINGDKNKHLIKKIKSFNKNINIFVGKYILKNKKSFNLNKKYLAFCGIGTPENFFLLLKKNKFKVEEKIIFSDHFNYGLTDINKIYNLALKKNLNIVTTEKDFMKIKKFKKLKTTFTKIDLKIDNYSDFKNFISQKL